VPPIRRPCPERLSLVVAPLIPLCRLKTEHAARAGGLMQLTFSDHPPDFVLEKSTFLDDLKLAKKTDQDLIKIRTATEAAQHLDDLGIQRIGVPDA